MSKTVYAVAMLAALIWQVPAVATAANIFPDKLTLLDMLDRGEFEALDQQLRMYQSAYQSGNFSEIQLAHVFATFETSGEARQRRLDEWLREMPDSYAALTARGLFYTHLGWLSRGAKSGSKTRSEQPKGMEDYFTLAASDLTGALEINPRIVPAYRELIPIAMARCDHETMKHLAEVGLRDNPDAYYIHSTILFALRPVWCGSLAEIEAYLDDIAPAIERNPALRILRGMPDYVRAKQLTRLDREVDAIEYFDKAIGYGDDPHTIRDRGKAYSSLGDNQKALADYRHALTLRPQTADYLNEIAWVHRSRGDHERSREIWNRVIALDPLNPDYLRYRSYALESLDRYDEAIRDLEDALILGLNDAAVWHALGLVYLKGPIDYEKAAEYLATAHDLDPTDTRILYRLSIARLKIRSCEIYDSATKFAALCLVQDDCKKHETDWAREIALYRFVDVRCWFD